MRGRFGVTSLRKATSVWLWGAFALPAAGIQVSNRKPNVLHFFSSDTSPVAAHKGCAIPVATGDERWSHSVASRRQGHLSQHPEHTAFRKQQESFKSFRRCHRPTLLEADQALQMTKTSLKLLWGKAGWCHPERRFNFLRLRRHFLKQRRVAQTFKTHR